MIRYCLLCHFAACRVTFLINFFFFLFLVDFFILMLVMISFWFSSFCVLLEPNVFISVFISHYPLAPQFRSPISWTALYWLTCLLLMTMIASRGIYLTSSSDSCISCLPFALPPWFFRSCELSFRNFQNRAPTLMSGYGSKFTTV